MVQNMDSISIPNINMADAENEAACFKDMPIKALSSNTRRQLSKLLNSRKYLRSEGGYCRDWRGIATLTQQMDFFDESAISGSDPTNKVLDQWYKFKPSEATFANLQQLLGLIDRWDASDDIYENLVEDAKNYKTNQRRLQIKITTPTIVEPPTNPLVENESEILTIDDARLAEQNLPPQIYDAFVLYADADAEFASEIKRRLEEDGKNNFKLCFKHDVLPGETFVHQALSQLIEQRCNRLIVIITKEFRKSPEDEFLVTFAQAVQIQKNTRKIIPIIYDDDVELPRTLKYLTHLRYSNGNALNFWTRLAASIRSISYSPEVNTTTTVIMPAAAATTTSIKDSQIGINSPTQQQQQQPDLSNLPTPPMEIPSINITLVPDDHDSAIAAKESRTFKKNISNNLNGTVKMNGVCINNNNSNNKNLNNIKTKSSSSKLMNMKNLVLRHAHSTSQLNGKNYNETNVSSSDVSVSSHTSENRKGKKKKWSSKFLNKVFSRSSAKLQSAV